MTGNKTEENGEFGTNRNKSGWHLSGDPTCKEDHSYATFAWQYSDALQMANGMGPSCKKRTKTSPRHQRPPIKSIPILFGGRRLTPWFRAVELRRKTVKQAYSDSPPLALSIGRTHKGLYTPRGCSRHLLQTPFSEPLLRTLLKTIVFVVKTKESPFSRPFPRTHPQNLTSESLETFVVVQPPRRAPNSFTKNLTGWQGNCSVWGVRMKTYLCGEFCRITIGAIRNDLGTEEYIPPPPPPREQEKKIFRGKLWLHPPLQ